MPERQFEFWSSVEWKKALMIESNAEDLARASQNFQWHQDGRGGFSYASVDVYISNTGNLCKEGDPLLAGMYSLHFERDLQADRVSLICSFRMRTCADAPFDEVDEIVEVSAERAAEQMSQYPRYMPETKDS